MDTGDLRSSEKTNLNTDVQNDAASFPIYGRFSSGGARPKTNSFQRTRVYRDKRDYDRSKRPKSSYEVEGKQSEKYKGSEKLQDGDLYGQNRSRGYRSWRGGARSRGPMNLAKHKQKWTCDDSCVWERGLSSPSHSEKTPRQWSSESNFTSANDLNWNKTCELSQNVADIRTENPFNRKNDHRILVNGSSSQSNPKTRESVVCKPNEDDLCKLSRCADGNYTKEEQDKDKSLRRKRVISFPFLKNLVGKDPGYIILELTKEKSSLKDCLGRTSKEWDFLELFLHVLSDAFTSRTTPNLMIGLFETLKEGNFFGTVILYFIDVMTMTNDGTADVRKVENVLRDILSIIMEQITRNPSSFHVFGRILTIIGQVIENLMKCWTTDDAIVSKYRELTEEKKRFEAAQRTNDNKRKYSQEPPDDFRQYPVSPSPDEIIGTVKPFLRPNKVEGKYDDLDHYLDVQFRLLREDFVGPLREGITEYIKRVTLKTQSKQMKGRDLKLDIKIYENVRVHTPVVTEHGLCYKLQLEMNKSLKQINWGFSKRLIYGSMVCLTESDFNSFLLATVVGRDDQDIKNGIFIVHFEQEDLKTHDVLPKVFRMAESYAHFESYRHVFSSLQTIKQGDLPFEKYIVNCVATVDPPAYLKKDCVYDLRPLTDEKYELQSERRLQNLGTKIRASSDFEFPSTSVEAKSVRVCNKSSWPSKELLHLDESQYRAVQTALTKEFAIIQGPPGTGKTHIGLQIVKALLHNKSLWASSEDRIRPMLVVCYTNHALDQFIEGIHKFFKGDILRVGGRSDSTVLRNCNLKYYRRVHQPLRTKLGKLQQSRKQAFIDLEEQSVELEELATSVGVYHTEIIGENFLRPEIGHILYNSLVEGFKCNAEKEGFSYILTWLEIEQIQDKCRRQFQNETTGEEDKFLYVEDYMKQRQRNFSIDSDEESRKRLEERAKELLQKIRRTSSVVFYIDGEKCTLKDYNISNEKLNEIKSNRLLKATIEQKISDPDVMSEEEADSVQDVWQLEDNAKWRLYRFWVQKLCMKEYEKIEAKRSQFEEASERYREALLQEEKEIMRQASVIGMTTSGAARYQSVLRDINPRIIVVEEAAEVLEAHIITTLSKGCEHLILIGDHKQLRPNPNVYKLATRYKLNISLFERMIKNRMTFNCLELQHRMRPEISTIVRHIYPDLQDHDDVKEYPNVKGISENVFLINHVHPEEMAGDSKSYSNIHEAQYVAALCRYLLLQGYKRCDITILTTYTGQLMCMRNVMPRDVFQGVKATVVDNYQGEENQIVILSLVRSNDIEKIGFLKTENRICVALSRAKVGFYIIGNFHHLAAHSLLWKKIVENMKDKGSFGNGLILYCQNHPQKQQPLIAINHGDFDYAPEGGCSEICNIRLKCGHKCRRHCHVIDKTHDEYKCTQSCTKILCDRGHVCPDKCYVTCGQCQKPVSKPMPTCGHEQTMKCFVEPTNFSCKEPCEKILKCGHRCDKTCGESHTKTCVADVNVKWKCGHTSTIKCWERYANTNQVKCPHPCNAILKCDHSCGGTCGKCFSGRVHQPCKQKCKRVLVCGHECNANCNNCLPCTEKCQNRCVHSVCDKLCGEPCVPCKEPCSWKCHHYKCTKLCSEPCDRPLCNEPCENILKCGHICIGLCGEPCPTLCRLCDEEIVTEIFFGNEDEPDAKFVLLEDCNHIVESKNMDEYMKMDGGDLSIQIKTCPICKTPIRKCLRYGKLINRVLTDIERVKKEMIGDNKRIALVKSKIKKSTESFGGSSLRSRIQVMKLTPTDYAKEFDQVRSKLGERLALLEQKGLYSERQLNTVENQCMFAVAVVGVRHNITQDRRKSEDIKEMKMLSFLKELLLIILEERDILTEQEIDDFKREIERARIHAKYLKILKSKKSIRAKDDVEKAKDVIRKIRSLVFCIKPFTEEVKLEADECIKSLKALLNPGGLGITEDERLEIVNAVGLSKGHWFKCPNNHIYAIGECGGASQKSTCPECNAEIGGERHKLTEGNKLAPEMDGASYAAYSEEANNLANFDLNNLH